MTIYLLVYGESHHEGQSHVLGAYRTRESAELALARQAAMWSYELQNPGHAKRGVLYVTLEETELHD